MNKIKIAIVEDDVETRDYLFSLINGSPGITCTAVFSNAEDLIQAIRHQTLDVVLMDIHLPGMSGIDCISKLKPDFPEINFIICTVFEDVEIVFRALEAGATGYLVKSIKPAKLLESIEEVFNGGSPMSGHIARKVVTRFNSKPQKVELLSPRETEILDLLSKGHRYREIADLIHISVETVRTHVRNIYSKLHVKSRFEAINRIQSSSKNLENLLPS